MTADQRRGVFTSAIRDPLTGQPLPEQHDSRLPHRSRWPRRSSAWCRCRTRRARTISSASRMSRTTSIATSGASTCERHAGGQRLRPLHRQQADSLRARLVLAACSTARRRRPGAGTFSTRRARWAAGRRSSARRSSTSRGFRMGAAAHRTASRIRSARTACAQIGFKGVPDDRTVPGGIVGIDIAWPHPHGLAELHAEVPAHRSGAVDRTRCPGCAAAIRSSSASTSWRR